MYYGYYFDPTYILVIIGLLLTLMASALVNSTYAKYKRVRSMSGMTGAQAAERILHQAGIYDVQIRHIAGDLTDNYNPKTKVLSLSDAVYGNTSVAAIGVQHMSVVMQFNMQNSMHHLFYVLQWYRL